MGEAAPAAGEHLRRGGKAAPRVGEAAPAVGEHAFAAGEHLRRGGKAVPRMGERLRRGRRSTVGERLCRAGERLRHAGEAAPRAGDAAPSRAPCSPARPLWTSSAVWDKWAAVQATLLVGKRKTGIRGTHKQVNKIGNRVTKLCIGRKLRFISKFHVLKTVR